VTLEPPSHVDPLLELSLWLVKRMRVLGERYDTYTTRRARSRGRKTTDGAAVLPLCCPERRHVLQTILHGDSPVFRPQQEHRRGLRSWFVREQRSEEHRRGLRPWFVREQRSELLGKEVRDERIWIQILEINQECEMILADLGLHKASLPQRGWLHVLRPHLDLVDVGDGRDFEKAFEVHGLGHPAGPSQTLLRKGGRHISGMILCVSGE